MQYLILKNALKNTFSSDYQEPFFKAVSSWLAMKVFDYLYISTKQISTTKIWNKKGERQLFWKPLILIKENTLRVLSSGR